MKFIFQVEASSKIGNGHIVRCLSLAKGLKRRGHRCFFVGSKYSDQILQILKKNDFQYFYSLSENKRSYDNKTIEFIQNIIPDWIIIDNYEIGENWELTFKKFCKKILVIDDLANRMHHCDLLLDQNMVADMNTRYNGLTPYSAELLLGSKYALLDSIYSKIHNNISKKDKNIKRILISFGGTDEFGLTKLSLLALLQLKQYNFDIDVVLSSKHCDIALIKEKAETHNNITLHSDLPTLAELMAKSDLAMGTSGTTSWERICLGLSSITITVADNQIKIADYLNKNGLTNWIGHYDQIKKQDIFKAVNNAIVSGVKKEWIERSIGLIDGKGVDRVCDILTINPDSELHVRDMSISDRNLVFKWANDPITRANSLSSKEIKIETHNKWFKSKLQDNKCRFYLIKSVNCIAVGMVRFEQLNDGNSYEVHYSIAPIYRGLGMGSHVLRDAIDAIYLKIGEVVIVGRIKKINVASERIFKSIGFKIVSEEDYNSDPVCTYKLNNLGRII